MRGVLLLLAAAVSGLGFSPVAAQEGQAVSMADTQLPDPVMEAEARELMESLRCLTCQSQSIADSDAAMAADMRHLVRSRMMAGETPEEIRGWLVERYGDYISYAPPAGGGTWPLYAIPLLILLGGIALFVRRTRRGS
ncbi:cytochrome c-type biogenesis protein CcmH [Altererythrobacter sp. MTPC7]|uniref:cytochrome c-type biogenesis protein n=1 Tax=Altererythrobacter sp. MTPC7 TaxID=3056567 RepID=UPI0036F223FF